MKELKAASRIVMMLSALMVAISIWDYTDMDEYKNRIASLEHDLEYETHQKKQCYESKDFEINHWRQLYRGCDSKIPRTVIMLETVECQIKEGKIILDTHNFCEVDKDGNVSFTAPVAGKYTMGENKKGVLIVKKVD